MFAGSVKSVDARKSSWTGCWYVKERFATRRALYIRNNSDEHGQDDFLISDSFHVMQCAYAFPNSQLVERRSLAQSLVFRLMRLCMC